MQNGAADNRTRLLRAAETVTYRHGFSRTALADIAKEAKFPLGNVYYYFKTKDELGDALVKLRVQRFRKLLETFDKLGDPKDRLCAFVQTKIKNRAKLARSGCPVGTMCSELHKHGGSVARRATTLFVEALTWMEKQFVALGKGQEAWGLALHLLSATQGVSVIAHAFHAPKLIETEAARLKKWIRAL